MYPRLGVNVDHVATVRELRKTPYPDILAAVVECVRGGAAQITVHLREDRRHIQPQDVVRIRKQNLVPLNLEMALTPAMIRFAQKIKPTWTCLVPEKRAEQTTEGGLKIKGQEKKIKAAIKKLNRAKIKVSLFVEPERAAVDFAIAVGAQAVEFHTGRYGLASQEAFGKKSKKILSAELAKLHSVCLMASAAGLSVHAGHGLDYANVSALTFWKAPDGSPLIKELNIGHAIVARALRVGLKVAVQEMRSEMHAP